MKHVNIVHASVIKERPIHSLYVFAFSVEFMMPLLLYSTRIPSKPTQTNRPCTTTYKTVIMVVVVSKGLNLPIMISDNSRETEDCPSNSQR